MSKSVSIFELPHDEAAEARQDDLALAEIEAGKGVPHEKVVKWLLEIKAGKRVPPPTA